MLRTIYLHGPLALRFGTDPVYFNADNIRQLWAGLRHHFPGFDKEVRKYSKVGFVKKRDEQLATIPAHELGFNFGNRWDEIHVSVAVEGAGAEAVYAAVAAEYGAIAATVAYVAYTAVIMYVMSEVLASLQDPVPVGTSGATQASTLFDGPQNLNGAGRRVQLVYGRYSPSTVTLNQNDRAVRQTLPKGNTICLQPRRPIYLMDANGEYTSEVLVGNTTASVNIFDNDLFKASPKVTSFKVNGVTKAPGQTYTSGTSYSITVTAAGVFTVTTNIVMDLSVTVTATDTYEGVTNNMDQVVRVLASSYEDDREESTGQ